MSPLSSVKVCQQQWEMDGAIGSRERYWEMDVSIGRYMGLVIEDDVDIKALNIDISKRSDNIISILCDSFQF